MFLVGSISLVLISLPIRTAIKRLLFHIFKKHLMTYFLSFSSWNKISVLTHFNQVLQIFNFLQFFFVYIFSNALVALSDFKFCFFSSGPLVDSSEIHALECCFFSSDALVDLSEMHTFKSDFSTGMLPTYICEERKKELKI